MKATEKCAKCECADIIRHVMVVSHDAQGECNVNLTVDGNPTAILLKKSVRSVFHAEVCSACGYVEFYADNPPELWAAFQKAAGSPQ